VNHHPRHFLPVAKVGAIDGQLWRLVRGIVRHLATKKSSIAVTDYGELNSLPNFTGYA